MQAGLIAQLRPALGCYSPVCLVELRVTAASISVEAQITMPHSASAADVSSVVGAASYLATLTAEALSNTLATQVTTQLTISLYDAVVSFVVAPPPPPPALPPVPSPPAQPSLDNIASAVTMVELGGSNSVWWMASLTAAVALSMVALQVAISKRRLLQFEAQRARHNAMVNANWKPSCVRTPHAKVYPVTSKSKVNLQSKRTWQWRSGALEKVHPEPRGQVQQQTAGVTSGPQAATHTPLLPKRRAWMEGRRKVSRVHPLEYHHGEPAIVVTPPSTGPPIPQKSPLADLPLRQPAAVHGVTQSCTGISEPPLQVPLWRKPPALQQKSLSFESQASTQRVTRPLPGPHGCVTSPRRHRFPTAHGSPPQEAVWPSSPRGPGPSQPYWRPAPESSVINTNPQLNRRALEGGWPSSPHGAGPSRPYWRPAPESSASNTSSPQSNCRQSQADDKMELVEIGVGRPGDTPPSPVCDLSSQLHACTSVTSFSNSTVEETCPDPSSEATTSQQDEDAKALTDHGNAWLDYDLPSPGRDLPRWRQAPSRREM